LATEAGSKQLVQPVHKWISFPSTMPEGHPPFINTISAFGKVPGVKCLLQEELPMIQTLGSDRKD